MRTLILSCRIGGGHDACARAIREEAVARGHECVTEDALRFIFRGLPAVFARSHVWIYRNTPSIFGKVYRYGENHPAAFEVGTPFRQISGRGTKRLIRYLCEKQFDAVICTHVFPAMMVTDALRQLPDNIKKPFTCFVATDYTSSPGMAETDLDCYFIPDRALEPDFTVGSITPERMRPSGIPVRSEFYRRTPVGQAKRALGLAEDSRHMVMMCGSMGCGPMYGLTVQLAKSLRPNEQLTVVCGTNRALFRKLQRKCKRSRQLRILSYVKDVSGLLDSADLYLTKPGGISVTEAAEKQLPMILIDAVAGCEDYNLHFFTALGAAKTADTTEALAALCLSTLRDPAACEKMAQAYRNRQAENGATYICDVLDRHTQV